MDSNKVFKANLRKLLNARGISNTELARLSTNAGYDLTKSYVGKVLHETDQTNVTLSKVDGIAKVLNVTPIDLINPMGIDPDGELAAPALNLSLLQKCIADAKRISKDVGIDDPGFEAKATALHYEAEISQDDSRLQRELLKLVRDY